MRPLASRRLFPDQSASSFRARNYLLAYDGQNGNGHYGIGMAGSWDGYTFTKLYAIPAIAAIAANGSWAGGGVKDPWLLKFGQADYRMWHSGYTTPADAFSIGYATSSDGVVWTESAANPIISPSVSGWDAGGVQYPVVFYEPSDASRPFKMWYVGTATVGAANYSIGYAYSTDGINWTKSASNPVLTYTTAGFSTGIAPGPVVKSGSTYYMYCNGRPTPVGGISGDVVALFTFTNPEGTYTSGGTLLSPSTAKQSLTSNLSSGSVTVNVTATAAFHVGEPCLLLDSTNAEADVFIQAIGSGTQMTLTAPASYSWTTANSATIRSLYYGSLNARSFLTISGTDVLWLAPFQQFAGSPFQERSAAGTSSSLGSGWAFDYTRGFVLPLGPYGAFDTLSAENPCVIAE